MDTGKYINIGHGFQGLGVVVCPLLLGIFGVTSLKFFGAFIVLLSLPLLFIPSPNN